MKRTCFGVVVAALLAMISACGLAADSLRPLDGNAIPRTLDELWGDYDPATESLDTEVLATWEQDGVVGRLVRFHVGTFKGVPATVAAVSCCPKGGTALPGLLHLHGGGQSASLDGPMADAANGYASLSLNWGGNAIPVPVSVAAGGTWNGPQTDWGALDATHPPQRNPVNHFAGGIAPDDFTLDAVESPRNSNWFIVLIAARRGLTFLERQPEVDSARLGVYGHSMGGKLTTNLAGIDRRVKAAVPSCGGGGEIDVDQANLPGCTKTKGNSILRACIADNVYIPRITCPILWLSPTNDFHAVIDNMAWNWRDVPDALVRFSITPHRNHVHDDAHGLTRHLFFEQHLKRAPFAFPRTPRLELVTKTTDGVPVLVATPDESQPVRSVDIYYAVDPHPLTRFWRDAQAAKHGGRWTAPAPLLSLEQPLFAYADVTYDTPEAWRHIAHPRGSRDSAEYAISSRVLAVAPAAWQAAGVRATDLPDRLIDAGDRGWHDWIRSNWDHAPLWTATTAKVKDPKWRGPDGATLAFEIRSTADNTLAVVIGVNAWGAYGPTVPAGDHVAVKELKASPEWQTVVVGLEDLVANDPKAPGPLGDWRSVTSLRIGPGYQGGPNGRVTVAGRAWQGPREIRNLRWEGGRSTPVPAPAP